MRECEGGDADLADDARAPGGDRGPFPETGSGDAVQLGSPDTRAARGLLAEQPRDGYLRLSTQLSESAGAVPPLEGEAAGALGVETKEGVACVRFVPHVDWQVLVLVNRVDGRRMQFFTLRVPPDSADMSHSATLPADFRLYSVEVPPMRWDSAKMEAVREPVRETKPHRGVTFVIKFGQARNALRFRHSSEGVFLDVCVCDDACRVRNVDIVSCGPDGEPVPARDAAITNLCGKMVFAAPLDAARLQSVLRPTRMEFGCVFDVPTIAGRMALQRDLCTLFVKGACDFHDVLDDVYLLVVTGAVGANIDTRIGDSLLERTVRWHKLLRGILSVYPRSEEESNRLEFVSHYTADLCDALLRVGGDEGGGGLRTTPHFADARLHISITRRGQVIIRFGFENAMLSYDAEVDAWAHLLSNAYIRVFANVLSGSLTW